MNFVSRTLTGGTLILVGLVFIFLSLVGAFPLLIYGIPLFVVGLFLFFNKNEDKIEEIKKQKGGKKK